MKSPLPRYLFAAAGGVLWGLCFGRVSLSLASWIALVPLVAMLAWPRPGWLGWVHGLAAWMTGLYWIVPTLQTFGHIALPLGVVLTGLLAAYLALYHAAFAWLGSRLWRRGGLARLLTLPALWVALEWLRTYLGGGFPWNLAGYAWVDVPGALPLAAWIGVYGVSFLVVLASVAVAASAFVPVATRRWEPAALGIVVPLLLLPLAARWSLRQDAREAREAGGFGKPVRLLQPNIPNLVEFDRLAVERNYRKVIDLSLESCQPGALVVWPESAAWPFQYGRDPWLDQDLAAMIDRGCTVLFNSGTPVGSSFYNSAFLLSASQKAARYDKRHLVPFGEYVPFRGVFGWMDKLARDAGEFRPADQTVLLPWNGEEIGMSICYEVVFPAEVAGLVQQGATLLVTITNDAWYGDTSAPWQHFRAARFRAAENRRPLLRAAITGVSAFVAPDGSVRSEIGVFREGVIRARVLGERRLTPFSRAPWLVPLLSTVIAAIGYTLTRKRGTSP
ncbi:MAG TPA: apolipoprotein N-acyltransferase [Thermoanaerobaculia bacterium]|jgi:apolipoprotein N-acyltransferase|nr:apolipoprotein N-acyltransferase [Thermoanaerobaculia bacterium]